MAHPSESGHWYDKDGKPCYEVPYADPSKGMRPTTLGDAKKLGLLPSVTTIINEANKPGLNRWKEEQVLHAALTLPRIDGEPEKDYLARIMRDSQEQAKKAAERGTAIHAAIQIAVETENFEPEMADYVMSAMAAIDNRYNMMAWDCEKSFASPLGYGGKTDLSAHTVVLDVKTKEFADTEKKLAWDEHCIQLAAYREGLGIPKAVCANVFVSVNNPGLVHIHEWSEDELRRGWAMFKALLDYWYARTGLKR